MNKYVISLFAICALIFGGRCEYVRADSFEISGYGVDSCTTVYTVNNSVALGDWLDESKRVKSAYSVGPIPVANISCTAQAVVGVKKMGGKLSLEGTSSCDYDGSGNGAATCVKYTAVVDWALVAATSPADDVVPESGHNSTSYASGSGVYTAHIAIAPARDSSNPVITAGSYTDTLVVRVGNSF